jgi:hypothetical protein
VHTARLSLHVIERKNDVQICNVDSKGLDRQAGSRLELETGGSQHREKEKGNSLTHLCFHLWIKLSFYFHLWMKLSLPLGLGSQQLPNRLLLGEINSVHFSHYFNHGSPESDMGGDKKWSEAISQFSSVQFSSVQFSSV